MNCDVHCNFDPCSQGTGITLDDHVAIVLIINELDGEGSRRVEYLYDPSLPLPSFSASKKFLNL
jgi:hypothetical protein